MAKSTISKICEKVWRGILADVMWVARFVYEKVVPVSNAIIILVQQMAYALFDMISPAVRLEQSTATVAVGLLHDKSSSSGTEARLSSAGARCLPQ